MIIITPSPRTTAAGSRAPRARRSQPTAEEEAARGTVRGPLAEKIEIFENYANFKNENLSPDRPNIGF